MYEKYPGGYEQTIMELRQEIYAFRNKKMAKLIWLNGKNDECA